MRPLPHVVVNCICQLDWAAGGQISICLDVILGVSVQMFLDEMDIWISGLSSVAYPSQCGWSSPVRGRWEQNREVGEGEWPSAPCPSPGASPDFRPCRRLSCVGPLCRSSDLFPITVGANSLPASQSISPIVSAPQENLG